MGTANSFNGFSFDRIIAADSGYIYKSWETAGGRRITSQETPRSDVAGQQDGGRKTTRHRIQVFVQGSSAADFRTRLHDLINNLDGVEAKLYRNSDKFWYARLVEYPYVIDKDSLGRITVVQLEFESADPFLYSDTAAATTQWGAYLNPSTPDETKTVNNAGEVYAGRGKIGPVFTLAGPLKSPVVVTRTSPAASPNQSFTINEDVAGGTTWIVDVAAQVVKKNGTETYTNFSGDAGKGGLIELEPGNNDIRFQAANGDNSGNMTLGFTPRDRGVD